MEDRKRILIYPIHNEIIPQRLLSALAHPDVIPYIKLTAVAGREPNGNITKRLEKEIERRKGYMGRWRNKLNDEEISKLYEYKDRIEQGLPYFQLNEKNCSLPEEAYELCDCVFIGTNNPTHVPYTLDTFKHGKSFVIEKPYAVTEEDLEIAKNLEKIIEFQEQKTKINLVRKITAHFAHKPASLVLFEHIDEFVNEYGKIKNVEGFYEEFDDPEKPRTIATLNAKTSGGGIYQDTGCHLEMMLIALGAKNKKTIEYEWDQFKGYGVETYSKVKHEITGERFTDDAKLEITGSKFADKYIEPLENEHKELILTFDKDYEADVLFSKAKIEIRKLGNNKLIQTISANHPSNEYVNIMKEYISCLFNGKKSFTNTQRGIEAMEVILSVYKNFQNNETRIKKYRC